MLKWENARFAPPRPLKKGTIDNPQGRAMGTFPSLTDHFNRVGAPT